MKLGGGEETYHVNKYLFNVRIYQLPNSSEPKIEHSVGHIVSLINVF